MLDLEAAAPQLRYEGKDRETRPYFEVEPRGVEVFTIYALAKSHLFEWSATLTIINEGREHVVEISERGRPFEVTGRRRP